MAVIKGKDKRLSLNVQHDYLTLRTPNGNYTTSWNGAKASGKLALNKEAFSKIDKFVETERNKSSVGKAMELLLDPKVISKLWKEWSVVNEPVKVTDSVVFIDESSFSKRYPKGGVVVKASRKTVYIKITEDLKGKETGKVIGFDSLVLKKK